MSAPVQKGETVDLEILSLAFGGMGVARIEGYTVFVTQGLPGQRVRARVVTRRRQHAEALILEVLEPSPDQIAPRCAHHGPCGGCAWQHLDLLRQREAKRAHVAEAIRRIAGLDVPVEPALASPRSFDYRNKMEFSFSTRWILAEEAALGAPADRFGVGLFARGRFDRVIDVERCHLYPEEGSSLLAIARRVARESGFPPYDPKTHRGFWRFFVLREGTRTGDRMVHVITNVVEPGSREWRSVERLAEAIQAEGPRVTSLLHGMTDRKSSVAVADRIRVLHGEGVIRETFLGLTYEIGPNTFFQTNTLAAERLFEAAMERGAFLAHETVWDLYSGAGALSLPIARRVKRVVGVEVVEEATIAARKNAERNGIQNATFIAGDVRETMASLPRPDAVVLDPPRNGVHPEALDAVASAGPSRIVYVSCNPATFARDAGILGERGYRTASVLPADFFPHTPHIECLGVFRRDSP